VHYLFVKQMGKGRPFALNQVLNEMVIDRGSSAFLTNIECYEKGRFISRVQADGIMLATPTGARPHAQALPPTSTRPAVAPRTRRRLPFHLLPFHLLPFHLLRGSAAAAKPHPRAPAPHGA
jgi:hypothetical protein